MEKNDIYLGDASKKMPLFQKICPKKCTHASNIGIGPGVIFFGFWYSLFT